MKQNIIGRILLFAVATTALGAIAGEKTKVACIGDSITYGYGLANRAEESYPAQLQRSLDAKSPGEYEVRNFGKGRKRNLKGVNK